MAPTISLRDLVGELQTLDDELHAYLNKVTGELITISDDDISMAEDVEEDELSGWQADLVQDVKKVCRPMIIWNFLASSTSTTIALWRGFVLHLQTKKSARFCSRRSGAKGHSTGSSRPSIIMASSRTGSSSKALPIRKLPLPGWMSIDWRIRMIYKLARWHQISSCSACSSCKYKAAQFIPIATIYR